MTDESGTPLPPVGLPPPDAPSDLPSCAFRTIRSGLFWNHEPMPHEREDGRFEYRCRICNAVVDDEQPERR